MNPPPLPPAILVSRISSRSALDSDACPARHYLCCEVRSMSSPPSVGPDVCRAFDSHVSRTTPAGTYTKSLRTNSKRCSSGQDHREMEHQIPVWPSRLGTRAGRSQLAWLVPSCVQYPLRGEGGGIVCQQQQRAWQSIRRSRDGIKGAH